MIVLSIVLSILFLSFIWSLVRFGRKKHFLAWSAAVVFVAGTVVHYIGFSNGFSSPFPSTLLNSLISSAEFFLSKSHYINIAISNKLLPQMPWYGPVYVFNFAFALSISLYYLIAIFGKRLRSRGWLRRNRRRVSGGKWYLMFGVDENTVALSRDLAARDEPGGIIFLEEPRKDEAEVKISLTRLGDFFSVSENSEERVRRLLGSDAVTVLKMSDTPGKAFASLSRSGAVSAGMLCREIGLPHLEEWLSCTEPDAVSLFVIGDSEERNVEVCKVFLNLSDINCRIYCHAHNPDNPVVYYPAHSTSNRSIIEYVDASHLAVQQLKKECNSDGCYPYHPINYVDIAPEGGYVCSTFSALILGFGQTGQEALDFLYSFGAFAGKDGSRSPYRFVVCDSSMQELEGGYKSRRPGMDFSNISFISEPIGSSAFWELVGGLEVNYAVVSLGDDARSLSMATSLLDFIRNRDKLVVLARLQNPSRTDEEKIAFYNKKYPGGHISLFGSKRDIWRYNIITNYSIMKDAADYYDSYMSASGESASVSFSERHEAMVRGIKGIGALDGEEFVAALASIYRSYRQECQNLENSLHRYTEQMLCPANYRQYASLIANGYTAPADASREMLHFPDDAKLAKVRQVFELLAIGEHLRWQASHETMGYVPGAKTDDIARTHTCMLPFARLDEIDANNANGLPRLGETKHYDWLVVKTALI